MKSVKWTVLLGLAIWFVWVSLVVITYEKLPPAGQASPAFVAGKWVSLAMIVSACAVLYLRRASTSSGREGLAVGVVWTGIVVALDLSHYVMQPFDVAQYFALTVPMYVLIPFTTTLVLGALRRRTERVE